MQKIKARSFASLRMTTSIPVFHLSAVPHCTPLESNLVADGDRTNKVGPARFFDGQTAAK